VYKHGFKCLAETQEQGPCGYIVRTLRDMQEHCCKEHKSTTPPKRGRPYQGQPATGCQIWAKDVWCQKFQPTGPLARRFEVHQPSKKGSQVVADSEGPLQQAHETMFTQSTTAIKKARQDVHAQIRSDDNRFVWH
jgi:hypothetical protein